MSVTISALNRCSVRLYLLLFVRGFMPYLGCLALFAYSGVQHILCCVLVCFSSSYVSYVSLDCPFFIAPSVFSNVYLQCYLSQHHALMISHTNAIICIFFERNMKCL